jgi:hypothetical protein
MLVRVSVPLTVALVVPGLVTTVPVRSDALFLGSLAVSTPSSLDLLPLVLGATRH